MPKKLSKKSKMDAARRKVEKKAAAKKSGKGKKNMFSNAASGSY